MATAPSSPVRRVSGLHRAAGRIPRARGVAPPGRGRTSPCRRGAAWVNGRQAGRPTRIAWTSDRRSPVRAPGSSPWRSLWAEPLRAKPTGPLGGDPDYPHRAMKVILPDETELELPDGATGLDAARAIGPKLAEQAVLVKADGAPQDLRLPLADGASLQILTTRDTQDPDALAVLRHSAAHLLAEAVRRLYPGVKVAIGPPIENGFYYDFEFPTPINDADLEAIEAEVRRELDEGRAWEREEITADEARATVRGRGRAVQGRARRYRGRRRSRSTRRVTFTDLCRGPAPPDLGADQGLQAHLARRRLLARRREEHPADAHLRDRLLQPEGPRRAPRAARAGARARPPAARSPARPVPLRRAVAGVAVLASEGDGDLQRARGSPPPRECAARLPRGEDAADLRQGAVGDLGPLGEVPREHVPDPDRRRAHLRRQADELPRAHAAVRQPAAELPRPTAALRRGRAAASQRARGCAPRAHAGPVRDAGRRPYLLRPGTGRRRAGRLARVPRATCTASSGSSLAPSSRPGPTTSSAATRNGTSPRGSSSRPSTVTGSSTSSAKGEGSFYGPKIDLHITDALDRSWQLGHDPARRPDAGPLRAHLHGRRQPRAPGVRRSTGRCSARSSASSGS